MASKTIGTILNLKDNFSKTINKTTNNTKQFQRQLKHTQNSMMAMKNSINSAFKGMALKAGGLVAGIGLANLAKESIMLASDLEEVKNVVDTTFGSSSKTIDEWSKNAIKAFGIGELEAKQFNGTLGAMMKTAGFSGDTLAKMTTDVAGLAGDIASFRNMEPAEAFEKLKSIVTGSSEPVEALGLDFRVASLEAYAMSKGIKKAYKDMSNAEQIQLRYNYTMEKTKDMQGDFNKTSDGFANQLRIMKTQLKQLGASIAGYALPFLNKMLIKVTGFIDLIPKGIESIKDFINRLKSATSGGDVFNIIMESANDILFKIFPRKFADFISTILGSIVGFGTDVYDNVVRISGQVKEPFMSAFNAVKEFIGSRIGDIQTLLDEFSNNSAPLIENAFNKIKDTLSGVFELVEKVFNFVNDNWGLLEPIIAGVTGAIVAYNIAMKAAVMWTSLVKAAQAAWTIVTNGCNIAMGLLNGTIALSPFGWLIIIIGAVIAIGVALWKNWDTIKTKASELKTKVTEVFEGIKTSVTEKVEKMKTSIIEKWQSIKDFLSNPIKGTVDIVKKGLSNVGIGENALGTNYFRGGLSVVGERGPELVSMPGGAKVTTADKTKQALGGNAINVNVTIQGNVIGNEQYADYVGDHIASKIKLALNNI